MGCDFSQNKSHLNDIIQLNLEELGVKAIDEIFVEAIRIMRKIEEMRRLFIIRWNSLCLKSGAIVLLKPNFKAIIEGILWKISVDIKVGLEGIFQIELTQPYLQIKNRTFITDDLREIIDAYSFFMKYFWEKLDLIDTLDKEINNTYIRVKEEIEKGINYKELDKIKDKEREKESKNDTDGKKHKDNKEK